MRKRHKQAAANTIICEKAAMRACAIVKGKAAELGSGAALSPSLDTSKCMRVSQVIMCKIW